MMTKSLKMIVTLWPTLGVEDAAETGSCLAERVQEAEQNGMPVTHPRQLRYLLFEFSNIFRTRLGANPPA